MRLRTALVEALLLSSIGVLAQEAGDRYAFGVAGSMTPAQSGVVKGVPFSAESVTETVRTLADGNRIVRRGSAMIYRDSEGRLRREQTFQPPAASAGESVLPKTISIFDPVAGEVLIMKEGAEVAARMWIPKGQMPAPFAEANAPFAAGAIRSQEIAPHSARILTQEAPPREVESLGMQVMEGFQTIGHRYTSIIPAGEMGNEQPMKVVHESWFAPDIQMMIYSRHNNPLVGETVIRLTNISRSEPDPQLFELPPGVRVEESPRPPTFGSPMK